MKKKTSIIIILLFANLICYSQQIQICSSLNISSEKRFQNAKGIGIKYQHKISRKFIAGLGFHYNWNASNFSESPDFYIDSYSQGFQEIRSNSTRFAIRLNTQLLITDNDYLSLSLGPEVSYNYLWSNDEVNNYDENNDWAFYSKVYSFERAFGIGLVTNFEIKKIILEQLSLCLSIRPEIITTGEFIKGGAPIFSGLLGFAEFQIGLKYRINKK